MTRRVLIANRGEIAVRVIRACHDLGWTAIAVYSEADKDSLHVRLADEAVEIGPAPANESYLNTDAILQAAARTGAEAIHPGYGFLSENTKFARAVIDAGLRWVGPTPEVIEMMGDKAAARRAAQQADVPVVPGTGALADVDEALTAADKIGYPVLIKASGGGGGKGIRPAADAAELADLFDEARREVAAAFGDDTLYLEKALPSVRHVEVQVLGDHAGNVIHLYERECSLQRRRQKMIEEAPAPTLPHHLRDQMHAAAVRLAASVGYSSAGTVEFLADDAGNFYFIEMNTRIQVEHGVTEAITGVDLVTAQLSIAFDAPLNLRQSDVNACGTAIEVRINAENPRFNFFGSPGALTECLLPAGPGVRVDSGVADHSVVQPFYDSLMAKLVVWGADRDQAIARTKRAIAETTLAGPITTLEFARAVVEAPWFSRADFDTTTIEAKLDDLLDSSRAR